MNNDQLIQCVEKRAVAEPARARLVLTSLTLVWGSTFVVVQSGLEAISPFTLISLRFALAVMTLFLFRPTRTPESIRLMWTALPLSLSLLFGFCLQTVGLSRKTLGLQATTPARSAFLIALSVIIVSAYDYFLMKHSPRWRLLVSALLAAMGVYALFHPLGFAWHRGDTLTLIAAFVFAFYVIELSERSRRHEAVALALAQFMSIAVMAAVLALLAESPRIDVSWAALAALGYLGIICTALTFVLMTWAQARVSPVEAAVIYTLEPVIATALSISLGREAFSLKFLIGGGLVVTAMLLASTDSADSHPVAPPEGID